MRLRLSRETIFDDVAYWLTIVSVYFLVGVLRRATTRAPRRSTATSARRPS